MDQPQAASPIELVIEPRPRDLGGGFMVARVLPFHARRMVGPFVFLDQFGPTHFQSNQGLDVRPHPHIGLATVTYLLEGTIIHRDSLGSLQPITPGDVNWMTAGRGIVHSERSDMELRKQPQALHGLQLWVALPEHHEETTPTFAHHAASSLPRLEGQGVVARVIAGSAYGRSSPVETLSDLFFVDVALEAGASLEVAPEHEERALYLVEGEVEIDGQHYAPGRLLVFMPGRAVVIKASTKMRGALLGGEPLGARHIWWNFVSSRKERIEQAKEDWKHGRFDPVPGETDSIPLPEV